MLAATAFFAAVVPSGAEQYGTQADGALCPGCLCCSKFGWCGSTPDYCGDGCQSQCVARCSVASVISRSQFDQLILHRDDAACPAHGFYTYDAFVAFADAFPGGFGTTGSPETQKREVAAFLAQTSHETTGGWATAPDGPYAWGYCFKEETAATAGDYCNATAVEWPCAAGKKYYGRGPIQISWNYNYGPAGQALGYDLLNNPDMVAADGLVSFKTAVWFWMTPQSPKPSCHDVVTGSGARRRRTSPPGGCPGMV